MTKPLILWHASRADIDRPTIAGRTEGSHHANSGLGIYCATDPHDYIAGFGDHIHKMEVREDARVDRISVNDLQRMGQAKDGDLDRTWFEQERERRSAHHDVLLVIESNGYPSQAIILTDDAIRQNERMTKDEFLSQSISIMDSMKAHDQNQQVARAQAMQAQAVLSR